MPSQPIRHITKRTDNIHIKGQFLPLRVRHLLLLLSLSVSLSLSCCSVFFVSCVCGFYQYKYMYVPMYMTCLTVRSRGLHISFLVIKGDLHLEQSFGLGRESYRVVLSDSLHRKEYILYKKSPKTRSFKPSPSTFPSVSPKP